MGMYGDLLKKLDTGEFIKIEPGKPLRVRLLDHPYISQQLFPGAESVSTRFAWPVWDYEQGRVRILQQGKSVFTEIATACETWPEGDQMPSVFDVVIVRRGTGKNDTEYSVQTVPHSGSMPSSGDLILPDMAARTNGIPVNQVLEGKQPEVKAIGAGKSEDVVPTDVDLNKPLDLSDIPF